jgi:hypothetical protein
MFCPLQKLVKLQQYQLFNKKNILPLLKSRFESGLWIFRKIYENLADTEIN